MSLLDVLSGRSSVSEYLGGEGPSSPSRASGGQDNESIEEEEDGGRLGKDAGVPSSEPPATPDDVAARRRRTTQEPPATPPVALGAPVPLADVSGGAPPLPAAAAPICAASASPLYPVPKSLRPIEARAGSNSTHPRPKLNPDPHRSPLDGASTLWARLRHRECIRRREHRPSSQEHASRGGGGATLPPGDGA